MCHCESGDSGRLDTTVESFDRHSAVNVRASCANGALLVSKGDVA